VSLSVAVGATGDRDGACDGAIGRGGIYVGVEVGVLGGPCSAWVCRCCHRW
jgi:hypothetical protein